MAMIKLREYPHFWKRSVGSGHAALALRSDYQKQLEAARTLCGFERVRFHGVLDDDMSVYSVTSTGEEEYSYFNVDSVYDHLLSIGMRPLVELSFMPEALASYPNITIFHYKGGTSPPKSYEKWSRLIKDFVTHLVDRYTLAEVSQWDFEVWNEPNCDFWSGNQAEYFKLLQVTYHAIKSVHASLRVGGPATCQLQWIPETLAFAKANQISLDFISSHIYPTDWGNDNIPRDVMIERLSKARREVGAKMPLYITEFNSGLYCCLHDTPYASSFIISNMPRLAEYVDILSYWTFSDIFEEWPFKSAPFSSGFGLQTIYSIPKPSFRAFQLLHRAGSLRYNIPSFSTIDFYATVNATHTTVLISNWNTSSSPISSHSFSLDLSPITNHRNGIIERIDSDNANAQATWIAQGSPMYPSKSQIQSQFISSLLVPRSISSSSSGFPITIPPYGVVALTVPLSNVL